MIILVDFENTHVSGLDGYEYLNDSDTLVMYYSDENSAVNKGMVTDLKKRNVHVSLVKLLKQHSNALDMYIASTTGMFLESGEKICIVSKDKGYAAVRDFWHSLRGAEILLGETIKECFLNSEKNDDERIRLCKERAQKATLVDSFATMNTIPTRPTLSRANQRRRNRNINFTEVSEPASLIPNPLMFETPADQLVKQMKEMPFGRVPEASFKDNRRNYSSVQESTDSEPNSSVSETSDSKVSSERPEEKTASGNNGKRHSDSDNQKSRDRRRQDNRRRDSGNQSDRNTQKAEAPSTDKTRESRKPEAHEETTAAIVKQEPEKTAIIIRPEPKTSLAKSEPKYDPNRVQFVYDPVSRSMKKVGAAENEAQKSEEKASKDSEASSDNRKTSDGRVPSTDASTAHVSEKNPSETVKEDVTASKNEALTKEASEEAISENITAEEKVTAPESTNTKIATEASVTEASETAAQEAAEKVSERVEEATAPENSDDDSLKQEDGKDSDKKGRKRTTSRKSASKRKSGKKNTSSEEVKISEATVNSETEITEAAAETSSEVSTETDSENKPAEKKRGRKTAGKSRSKKAAASEDTSDEKKSEKKTKTAGKGGRKPAEKKSEASRESEKGASEVKSGKTPQAVSSDEAVQKYGLTANTLHTYYVRLIKAYGKEQGRAVYDMSKKAVQEDIKKRKAAEKAAEVSAE